MTTQFVTITVNTGADMASNAARINRGKQVAVRSPQTQPYQTDAGFKTSIDSYVKSTQDLEQAEMKVTQLEAELKLAREHRDSVQNQSDKLYTVCVSYVEAHCQTPAEVWDFGFVALQRKSAGGPVPALQDFRVSWDPVKKLLKLRATKDTRRPIRVEWCLDPNAPTPNWQRVGGSSAVQTLPDWPKGPASFRACIEGAKALGPWFGPVSIVVPG